MLRRLLLIVFGCLVCSLAAWIIVGSRNRPAPIAVAPASPPVVPRNAPPPAAAATPEPVPGRRAATRPARRAAPRETLPAPEPEATAVMGTLHIESDVAGAQVFIDRNYIGVAPVTSPDIAVGSHRVNVVAQGYDSIAETVEIGAGPRDLRFNFKEVRLDAAIDVVHKHRFGSCQGRLVATPQGLRYDSDDKDDRFTLPLADLELFEVDYMAKTLRVKGVKGKRFEFSDPTAANGDRLFVFHRDVDKARQRLKQVN